MKFKIGRLTSPIFFVLVCSVFAHAQKHEIGLGLGALNYSGDLSRMPNVAMSRPAVAPFYRYNFSPAVSLNTHLLIGGLAGKDNGKNAVSSFRNVNFEATMFQIGTKLEYNFLNYQYSSRPGVGNFTPYITGGMSAFSYTIHATNSTENPDNGSSLNFSIPFGFGFRYRVKSRINLNAEFIANKTFTDLLDGVSDYPVNNASRTKYLSNPLTSDWFFYAGFSISYTFFKIHCPD
jgi:hypothetical protein